MSKTQDYEAIVLRTHDVGEADRFCIVLTKERGKLAARARGARKPKSQLGGSLLPLQSTIITMREGSSGFMVSSVQLKSHVGNLSMSAFVQAQQGIELLLAVLEDDHPVPEIYELTEAFLQACHQDHRDCYLPFLVQLLQRLGVLPTDHSHSLFDHLSADERHFVDLCSSNIWQTCPLLSSHETQHLTTLCERVLEQQTQRSFKAHAVADTML